MSGIERTWQIIQDIAAACKRCPERTSRRGGGGGNSGSLRALARMGRLRIEISGRNFRRVTILEGLQAGKATAADPCNGKVWLVIDKDTPVVQPHRPRKPGARCGAPAGEPRQTHFAPVTCIRADCDAKPLNGGKVCAEHAEVRLPVRDGFIRALTKEELMRGRA